MKYNPIICAIDTPDIEEAECLISLINSNVGGIKLGLEFFTANGPEGIKRFSDRGLPVFLDLKFHDIPNTVAKAVKAACKLNPFMITIHTAGGKDMLKAAADAAQGDTILLGVTVLTSMDDKDINEIGVTTSAKAQVTNLATMAKNCGLSGVVCSAHEIGMLRTRFGPEFKLVVPGIRQQLDDHNDQKRVITPKSAMNLGADYLVIGRPITQAPDPAKVAQDILLSL